MDRKIFFCVFVEDYPGCVWPVWTSIGKLSVYSLKYVWNFFWNLAFQPLKTLYHHYHITESHQSLAFWSSETIWQTKTIISLLPKWILPPNVPGWWLTWEALTHKVTWPLSQVILQDYLNTSLKLKTLYLHYRIAYGKRTWSDHDIQQEDPMPKVTWFFNHVVLLVYSINKLSYVSTCTSSMTTFHDKVVTYNWCLPPIKNITFKHVIFWSFNCVIFCGHMTN